MKISKELSSKIIMTGVYYKNNHPGGISSVIQYWSNYIDTLRYIPSFKEGNRLTKIIIYIRCLFLLIVFLLFDRRVRVVHVHTAADIDFYRSEIIVNIAKIFNKRVVLHSHASQFKDYYAQSNNKRKKEIVHTLQKADVLIALSESWKQWFESIGVNSDKITILHNITAYPTIIEGLKPSLTEARKIRFLFLGEIGQRKGVFDILKALSNHSNEIKEKIELRIGGNKMEHELKKAIEDGGLGEFVKFEGWVSGNKKIELLNWADIFILPSFNEGLPISILEAMSYKMPIISTPVGGIPEVVSVNNGILVTPGDADQIYKAMDFYVTHRDIIPTQGDASYKKVETYLPDYVISQLKSIYDSII